MKKLLVLFCSAGVLLMAGCGSEKVTPEDVGKKYMEKRFAGAEANLTELNYDVVDTGDDTATVSIEGSISYKEQIFLEKKGGKWVVAAEAPEATEAVAEAAEADEAVHAEADAVQEPAADVEADAEPVEEAHDAHGDSHAPEEVAHH
ncbi:hypothetical protein [Desulfoluna butyratoxydans]|uniref:DUF4878 domain-containing protein n=1 Tax=Desulfoluna butyratoxydans TaxID=231438 RepID=A0A4U8YN89_9BACT|nr:hypothetical protein [Desulfoluna butyratoxydans]VFQ45545.1 hypothetical protein MSL71_32030 [Desulfoluna butyratoxydans]